MKIVQISISLKNGKIALVSCMQYNFTVGTRIVEKHKHNFLDAKNVKNMKQIAQIVRVYVRRCNKPTFIEVTCCKTSTGKARLTFAIHKTMVNLWVINSCRLKRGHMVKIRQTDQRPTDRFLASSATRRLRSVTSRARIGVIISTFARSLCSRSLAPGLKNI